MIAFLLFLVLTIAFIVGSVRISIYLYARTCVASPFRHQVVTLHQNGLIDDGLLDEEYYRQRGNKYERGMGECVRRVSGIGLAAMAVMLVLIIALFHAIP